MKKAKSTFIMTTPHIFLKDSRAEKSRRSFHGFRKKNSFSTTSFMSELNQSFVQPRKSTLLKQEENG